MRFYVYFAVFLLVSLCTMIFGFLHNQISYSISHELFEFVFFPDFGFVESGGEYPRLSVGIIGIWTTVFFGILMAFLYLIVLFISKSSRKNIQKAIFLHFAIAIFSSLLGASIGYLFVNEIRFLDPEIIPKIQNPQTFASALWMHNFSYAGGIIGCLVACGYLIYHRQITT